MAATPNFGWPTPDDDDLVSAGAQAIRALGDAIDASVTANGTAITALQEGFRFAGTRYYESSGAFAKADPLGTGDIGLRAIRVRVLGAGGGGAGCAATGAGETSIGGGGGGGCLTTKFFDATDLATFPASVTITRATGGAGGVGTAAASAGGDSSFATGETFEVLAGGGSRGLFLGTTVGRSSTVVIAFGGQGGTTTSGGDTAVLGSPAPTGVYSGATHVRVVRPPGGSSGIGGGGGASGFSTTTGSFNGTNGGFPGGGAGGGGATESQSAANGGNGSSGLIIVDCFV